MSCIPYSLAFIGLKASIGFFNVYIGQVFTKRPKYSVQTEGTTEKVAQQRKFLRKNLHRPMDISCEDCLTVHVWPINNDATEILFPF
jgi:hypothetical protein